MMLWGVIVPRGTIVYSRLKNVVLYYNKVLNA